LIGVISYGFASEAISERSKPSLQGEWRSVKRFRKHQFKKGESGNPGAASKSWSERGQRSVNEPSLEPHAWLWTVAEAGKL
jgi:hypothetical protein